MNSRVAILLKTSILENPKAPKVIILARPSNYIGRTSEIKIDTQNGKEISKHHCTIYQNFLKGTLIWIIEDQNSINGTFVNKKKIHRVLLKHGDEIVFGGGPQFAVGDVICTTDSSQCRYKFFVSPPKVHFCKPADVNITLFKPNTDETCSICYSPIVAAESLPCGHRFCLSCIHKWTQMCQDQMNPCVCPMCRASYKPSQLTPNEALLTEEKVDVYTVEPLLRELNITSCKSIKSVQIFKKWEKKHSDFFWSAYNKVKHDDIRRNIFLQLTHATVPYFVLATTQELKNAAENLGGASADCKKDLLLEGLMKFFSLLIPTKQDSPKREKSQALLI